VAIDPVTAIRTDQWNESPQAQEPDALGFSIVKPCFSIVSTKSLVAETGAATRLHGDAQLEIVPAFLGKQVADLYGRTLAEDDTLLRGLLLNGHLFWLPPRYGSA
jgi:hypothetical protein